MLNPHDPRLRFLISLLKQGVGYNADDIAMYFPGALQSDADRQTIDDLFALRRAGANLNASDLAAEAQRIKSLLPPRLRTWLDQHRPDAEVVAFVSPQDSDEQIVEKFVEAGAGKSTGRKKTYKLPPGHWRSLGSGRTLEKDGFTPLRRQKLAAAEKALADAEGDVRRAALALGVQTATLRRNLSYKHLDKRTAEEREAEREPKTPAPPRGLAESSPDLNKVDPALVAEALAVLKKFRQK